jgi:hypothetical protein
MPLRIKPSLPGETETIADLEQRVGNLEAVSPPSGSGIDFNKNNNSPAAGGPADYLEIDLNGDGQGPGAIVNPAALSIVNATSDGGTPGGMELVNDNDAAMAFVQTGDGGQLIRNDGAGDTEIKSDGGGDTLIDNTGGAVTIGTVGSAKDLTMYVKDGNIYWFQGGTGGSAIMALIWNGVTNVYDLHLQATSVITYDL